MDNRVVEINVPLVDDLPFSRKFFQYNPKGNENAVYIAGCDPIYNKNKLANGLNIDNNLVLMETTHKISNVNSSLRDGRLDVIQVVQISEKFNNNITKLNNGQKCDQLMLDSIESRFIEQRYLYFEPINLKSELDKWFSVYDNEHKKEISQMTDNEGFTLVQSGKNVAKDGTHIQSFKAPSSTNIDDINPFLYCSNLMSKKSKKFNSKKKTFVNFYNFQLRLEKEKTYLAMKKKSEDDQKVIKKMCISKDFKLPI